MPDAPYRKVRDADSYNWNVTGPNDYCCTLDNATDAATLCADLNSAYAAGHAAGRTEVDELAKLLERVQWLYQSGVVEMSEYSTSKASRLIEDIDEALDALAAHKKGEGNGN